MWSILSSKDVYTIHHRAENLQPSGSNPKRQFTRWTWSNKYTEIHVGRMTPHWNCFSDNRIPWGWTGSAPCFTRGPPGTQVSVRSVISITALANITKDLYSQLHLWAGLLTSRSVTQNAAAGLISRPSARRGWPALGTYITLVRNLKLCPLFNASPSRDGLREDRVKGPLHGEHLVLSVEVQRHSGSAEWFKSCIVVISKCF